VDIITKRATRQRAFARPAEAFFNARSALKAMLGRMGVPAKGGVLLPAYIGWSSREGSGVFDPVRELRAPYSFYRMTRDLLIDLDSLEFELSHFQPRVVLLIHYFGYPDPSYLTVTEMAIKAGSLVIEDEAHSLFSDVIGTACGRAGHVSVFSLHKMLAVDSGGLALFNDTNWHRGRAVQGDHGLEMLNDAFQYDFAAISSARRRNAAFLLERLASLAPDLRLLRAELPAGVVPQTIPILLESAPRDLIYSHMNASGYGVVSLYHTLIEEIAPDHYPEAHWIAERILNLPVHQDASLVALDSMLVQLSTLLRRWG